jgi:hypothetical protein
VFREGYSPWFRTDPHAALTDYGLPEFDTFRKSPSQSPIAFLQFWWREFLYGPIGEPSGNIAASPAPPLLLEVHDDSMEPTIKRGALVLVDRSFWRPLMKSVRPSATIGMEYTFLGPCFRRRILKSRQPH